MSRVRLQNRFAICIPYKRSSAASSRSLSTVSKRPNLGELRAHLSLCGNVLSPYYELPNCAKVRMNHSAHEHTHSLCCVGCGVVGMHLSSQPAHACELCISIQCKLFPDVRARACTHTFTFIFPFLHPAGQTMTSESRGGCAVPV